MERRLPVRTAPSTVARAIAAPLFGWALLTSLGTAAATGGTTDLGTTGALPFANPFPVSLLEPRAAEQALVVSVRGRGLVLVTGCGHPGLEALVTRAQDVYGLPVVGVVGGLHYEALGADQLAPHVTFLRALEPQLVALSPHDSGPAAIAAFRDAFPEAYREVRVGTPIVFGTPSKSGDAD